MIILGKKTTLRLLKTLLEDPLHKFKEIELINKAKTGKGSAVSIINSLIKENILLEKRAGKTKIIYLNLLNRYVFLLKNLFDREKLFKIQDSKRAALMLFKSKVKENADLLVVFGSCISETATEKSDIDVLVVSNNLGKINKERKKVEELFGERFNLHYYKLNEIKNFIKTDIFIQNALLRGVFIKGYDLGSELFSGLFGKKDLDRLFFFNERIKSARRNFQNKDYKAAKEIVERTVEQVIYYLLSDKGTAYYSKKDAEDLIKKMPEGKIIQKIDEATLKEKISISENFALTILKNKILEEEGYARRA